MDRLHRSHHLHYLTLRKHYEAQLKNYCGVASSVIILNALSILDADNQPYTQHSFFTKPVLEIISNETVAQRGFVFEELVDCLNTFPQICAKSIYADLFKSPEDLANTLIQLMNTHEGYMIANFNRKVLGQTGGGHYSPLAAFDEESHSVLILDVNERYGPYWIDIDLLWKSMQRIDDKRHYPRGLILLRKTC